MSPVVLVVLIAWALLSVIFLTGTLLAARSIDRSVSGVTGRTDANGRPENNIKTTVTRIGRDAAFIDEARKTVQISTAIRKAADPLSGHLTRTLTVASKGIDPKLKSILGKVGDINQTAGQINTNVKGIHGTVDNIFSSVISINDNVHSINSHVHSIGGAATSIRSDTSEINGSARSILGSLGGILARVNHIDGSVARINGQAETILNTARPIAKDLNDVLGLVGSGSNHGNTISGQANGIDCSVLLLNLLKTRGVECNK
jgi:methyl-accepting chemotaxis protein